MSIQQKLREAVIWIFEVADEYLGHRIFVYRWQGIGVVGKARREVAVVFEVAALVADLAVGMPEPAPIDRPSRGKALRVHSPKP